MGLFFDDDRDDFTITVNNGNTEIAYKGNGRDEIIVTLEGVTSGIVIDDIILQAKLI